MIHLTQSSRRAAVALMIEEQTGAGFAAALIVADSLDAVSKAVTEAAGLDRDTALVVLGELWMLTPLTYPRNGEFRVVEPCSCACKGGGRCGGCGHAGCGGRQ